MADDVRLGTVVDTPAGPMQYLEVGSGSPVLFVHGSPGGCDAGELMTRFLVAAGFWVICPSRPGYLDTPLTDDNATPAVQGQMQLAVMDSLGIDRFAVVCWSGGGPSSYRLAADHPDRVAALVPIAALSGRHTIPRSFSGHILERRYGKWIIDEMVRHSGKSLIKATLAEEGSFDKSQLKTLVDEIWADDDKRAFVLDLAAIIAGRRPGLENDVAQFPVMDDLGLGSITAPVLLVHGTIDSDVAPEHSDRAAQQLRNVERHDIEGGSHIGPWTGPGEVEAQAHIVEFLRAHPA
ncbi:MAG TPA: alpha/beta hydrolase [Acidimicrobiales bacterium]